MTVDIKIIVKNMQKPDEVKPQYKKPPLKEKIDYAIACVECGHDSGQAIRFLRKVHKYLESKKRKTEEEWYMLERVTPVMNNFGNYHLSSEGLEDAE